MSNTLKIGGIIRDSVVDGPGIRHVLFLQGCSRIPKCKGCHNEHLWNPDDGVSIEFESLIFDNLFEYVRGNVGLTLSGGEPLDQYLDLVAFLKRINSLKYFNNRFEPEKERQRPDIMLYTSYYLDEIKENFPLILMYLTYLVDGPYDCSLPQTHFAGSTNQTRYFKDAITKEWLTFE